MWYYLQALADPSVGPWVVISLYWQSLLHCAFIIWNQPAYRMLGVHTDTEYVRLRMKPWTVVLIEYSVCREINERSFEATLSNCHHERPASVVCPHLFTKMCGRPGC